MRRESLEKKMGSGVEGLQNGLEVVERHAPAAHAGIRFQMHGVPPRPARCRGLERLDMPRLPNRRSEAQADNLAFLAAPETGHQKNSRLDASVAQRNRLIERS